MERLLTPAPQVKKTGGGHKRPAIKPANDRRLSGQAGRLNVGVRG